jgi:hypothetical protein
MRRYPGYKEAREQALSRRRPVVYDYSIDPDNPDKFPMPGLKIKVRPNGSSEVYK